MTNILNKITFTAGANDKSMRLDKFLISQNDILSKHDISRNYLQNLIKNNHLSCDGIVITDSSYKLKGFEKFILQIPMPQDAAPPAVHICLDILFEDNNLLVINKPVGLTVHPAAGHYDDTLVNALLYHCGDSLSGICGVMRPGIVHRLDKDTSGVMVVAKNDKAHHHLSKQFADHTINRRYHAIIWGSPKTKTGTMSGNIGRSNNNRQKMAIVENGGRHAVTHFNVLKQYIIDGKVIFSLVEFRLETGRTHQIRVHSSSYGLPLIGDQLYGRKNPILSKSIPPNLADAILSYKSQALHAKILGFIHPITGDYLEFTSDYNNEFKKILENI